MPDSENGRVTLAIVQNELVHMRAEQQAFHIEMRAAQFAQAAKNDALEKWCTTSQERWAAHREEHTREGFVLKAWASIAGAVGGGIGGFLAWLASRP